MDEPKMKTAKRGRRCIVYGCGNEAHQGYFMHKMPGKMPSGTESFTAIQRRWISFIGRKRKFDPKDARQYSAIVVCSGHFRAEDYVATSVLMFEKGLRSNRPELKEGAIPTIDKAEHPFSFSFPVSTASPMVSSVVSSVSSTSTTSSSSTTFASSSSCKIASVLENIQSHASTSTTTQASLSLAKKNRSNTLYICLDIHAKFRGNRPLRGRSEGGGG